MHKTTVQNTPDTLLIIGRRLRARRLQRDMTQKNLASRAGVSTSAVKRIEKGKGSSLDTFLRIIAALGWGDTVLHAMPEPEPTPSELVEHARRSSFKSLRRQRASGAGRPGVASSNPPSPWQWGDQE